ncbi:mRNA cleavage and polyadenylation factor II complex, subunit PTA1 [Phaffia rhodozyma]|uniref:mRNA cleavage and polyadenylation factor II complex, subunit PTA1 n=1 Tax=Phaffia rhodozyma TaxID=264483 RepID=A0A0F7SL03_PHARH|nr:mRNA cleavage and polyadenylation factor II complex, subunit PTA1 [Phaffia rhodozyma]
MSEDALGLLTQALSAQEPTAQAELLKRTLQALEDNPVPIPQIAGYLLPHVGQGEGQMVITGFLINILEIGICRSTLPIEVKVPLSLQTIETLAQLLVPSTRPQSLKLVIQIFTSFYPLLFPYMCNNKTNIHLWNTLTTSRIKITEWATYGQFSSDGGNQPIPLPPMTKGIRIQAIKFLQRVVLVQSRITGTDPRLNNSRLDPNIAMVPPDHPFIQVRDLEQEGVKLIEFILTTMYTCRDTDLLTSLLTSLLTLIRLRTHLSAVFIPALTGWTPDFLTGLPRSEIRSVEKVVRALMIYLDRSNLQPTLKPTIIEALQRQQIRMDVSYREGLEESRAQKRQFQAMQQASLIPPRSFSSTPLTEADQQGFSNKRARLDSEPAGFTVKEEEVVQTSSAPKEAAVSSVEAPGSGEILRGSVEPARGMEGTLFDVSRLPVELVVDLMMANLDIIKEDVLIQTIRDIRAQLTLSLPPNSIPPSASITLLTKAIVPEGRSAGGAVTSTGEVEAEIDESSADVVNPLDRTSPEDDDDEDIIKPSLIALKEEEDGFSEDHKNPTLMTTTTMTTGSGDALEFSLPPPRPISIPRKQALVLSSLRRIWEAGQASSFQSAAAAAATLVVKVDEHPSAGGVGAGEGDVEILGTAGRGVQMWELWMVLIARLVTRGKEQETEDAKAEDDVQGSVGAVEAEMRRALAKFIADDFSARCKFAALWLNEEWYNDAQISSTGERRKSNYRSSLLLLMNTYLPRISGTSLIQFILDLPEIPSEVLQMVQTLCADPDRTKGRVGMKILKDLTVERPPVRGSTVEALLELCTHPDVNVRNPAIATVRLWIPDSQPMALSIKTFALHLLGRLRTAMEVPTSISEPNPAATPNEETAESSSMDADTNSDTPLKDVAEEPEQEEVRSRYLPAKLQAPVSIDIVRQHVELLFALTKKIPEFLDEIFNAYVHLESSVQDAFAQIITPLIRSLGPSHGKLLTVLRKFPAGAEALALKTVQLLTEAKDEKTKLSVPLVALVKSLVAERELSPKFILHILVELDKAEIRKQLPRIISILGGQVPEPDLVHQILSQLLTTPPQTFFAEGNGNIPRVKPSEQFSPAELMVLLHHCEKDSGLKATRDAIDICFSMTDVYRSEVLAVVMQQIVDEPELPTLFLPTIIKSVRTYKSLTGFVSTSLLSRLITKKIWTSPQPWEGFFRCARVLGMASYGALLQLPREQLKEIVSRPDGKALKAGLRDFVLKKAGGNTNRLPAWFPEVFAEDPSTPTSNVSEPTKSNTSVPAPSPGSESVSELASTTAPSTPTA